MLSLSIAKWPDSLNSQLLVYSGDRQAPPDLLNLLPEEADLDPDTWLTRHESKLAFLCRIANASNIQPDMFPKESMHIYKIPQILDMNEFPPMYASYVDSGTWKIFLPSWRSPGEISPELEKPQLGRILLYLLHHVETYMMHTPFLNVR